MGKEAQKAFFRARALEKRNSKRNHYNMNQICADDECSGSDREDHEEVSTSRLDDMPNWTSEDWVDYQNGSWVPNQNFW